MGNLRTNCFFITVMNKSKGEDRSKSFSFQWVKGYSGLNPSFGKWAKQKNS